MDQKKIIIISGVREGRDGSCESLGVGYFVGWRREKNKRRGNDKPEVRTHSHGGAQTR